MPPSENRAPSIGILALQAGVINQKQLMECIELQRSGGGDIEKILLQRGYLKPDQLDALRKAGAKKSGQQPSAPPGTTSATKKSTRPTGHQTAVKKPSGHGTSVVKKPTAQQTAVRRATRVTPALSDPSAEGTEETRITTKTSMKSLILAAIIGGIPIAILGGYLIFRPGSKSESPRKDPAPQPEVRRTKPREEQPAIVPGKVNLFRLNDKSPVAEQWNRVVAELGDNPTADTYARSFREVQQAVAAASGTPHEARLQRVYEEILAAIHVLAEEMFAFFSEQANGLAKAGKYADAVTAFDWFPGIYDPIGLYADKIKDGKHKIALAGREFYASLKRKAEELASAGKFEEAKRLMMQALEIGFPEITEEAFRKVSELSDRETESARKAEEESIRQFEKELKEQTEASAILETLRARFWDLVAQRKPDAAKAFLAKEKRADFAKDFEVLEQVLAKVEDLMGAAGTALRKRAGQSVTLAFVDGVRPVRIKDVKGGNIVDSNDVTIPVWTLHGSELVKLAGEDKARRAAAHLLADEFDEAMELAGGTVLATFIENSSGYIAKSEPKIRARAKKFEAEGKYDLAAREYSKLVTVPSLRPKALKDRARAHFQAENFVAAVLDVEQLFDLNVADREAIDVLNKSYERSALISKALAVYEKAAKAMPEDAHVLAALVGLYMKTHEYAKARAALDRARKLKNRDPNLELYAHLLNVDEKGAFAGKTYKVPWDRYIVETNVSQAFASEIAQFMGGVYKMYKKVFPYKKNENLTFFVKIFATESEFAAYFKAVTGQDIAKGFGKVGAYYMPTTKELVGWNSADLKGTLQHEGLHQFIDFYVDNCPHWFNEGFACIFETSTADEVRFNKERHENAKFAMQRKFLPSIRTLLLMDGATWNSGNYTVFYYGQSWSFIYFLIKQGRRDILDKYFDELMKGRTSKQAFDAVFGPGKVNLDELEAKWKLALFGDKYD